ncbi:hypothetical protein BJ138DRAFT_1116707 [Hygrophoropsis aurantiaca]|uniref:Uncharacterized protein n=1 Tax=Hygrophoropsis aurantiaca TaxID=72124 RepID=A0ACB8A305_9AGAM|nr:hypothetical protein BJ138DRAFT_1116707 [Hygrophoropsis aurantiaca]
MHICGLVLILLVRCAHGAPFGSTTSTTRTVIIIGVIGAVVILILSLVMILIKFTNKLAASAAKSDPTGSAPTTQQNRVSGLSPSRFQSPIANLIVVNDSFSQHRLSGNQSQNSLDNPPFPASSSGIDNFRPTNVTDGDLFVPPSQEPQELPHPLRPTVPDSQSTSETTGGFPVASRPDIPIGQEPPMPLNTSPRPPSVYYSEVGSFRARNSPPPPFSSRPPSEMSTMSSLPPAFESLNLPPLPSIISFSYPSESARESTPNPTDNISSRPPDYCNIGAVAS